MVAEPGYEVTWTEAGTYEIDIYQVVLAPNRTPSQRFFAWLIPTAHAASPGAEFVETIRFTVVEGVPPPVPCCSSVLFLPGFKGSILKTSEETLWPADTTGTDIPQLALDDETGESVNDVVVDGILPDFKINVPILGEQGIEVYSGLISYMDSLTDDNGNGTIHEWVPFAYDWRKPLQETVDEGAFWEDEGEMVSLVETVEDLAQESKTGKVTIVAHSMGGILGKMLIKKLEDLGEAELIDNFVMVATPQLGTPQAAASLLHGEGEGLPGQDFVPNIIATRPVVRTAARNFEPAYDLLPSREYFDDVTDPVIVFGNAFFTEDWRNEWGDSISNYDDFAEFVTGQEVSRDRPDPNSVHEPEVLRSDLVSNADALHTDLDSYEFPSNIRIVQIAGWGEETIKGIKYKTHFLVPGYEAIDDTIEGDGTVVYPSAVALSDEAYYLDLLSYNLEEESQSGHSDILNIASVQEILRRTLKSEPISGIDFVSATKPEPNDAGKRLRVASHSPVILGAYDADGNFTGIYPEQDLSADYLYVQQEIPGSSFLTYGESQYLYLPANGSYDFVYKGTGSGVTTIDIAEIENDTATTVAVYTEIPTTSQTLATFDVTAETPEGTIIQVDTNGDGQITPVAPDGYVPPPPSDPTISELIASLKTKIPSLNITPKLKTNLLKKIDKIEQKIEKQKERKSRVLENLEAAIAKKVEKGKIDALSAAEITTLLDELEASVAVFPLDPVLIQELRQKVESLATTPKIKTNLLKRVDRLEKMTSLLLSLERLTTVITNKGTQGKIPDTDAQELLDLLAEIEGGL